MIRRHDGNYCEERLPMYYIYDSSTETYFSSGFDWNNRGAKIPDIRELKKRLRVIAERNEESSRPKGWETVPHKYADLPASRFIPSSLVIVDSCKQPIVLARDIAQHLVIQARQPQSTN